MIQKLGISISLVLGKSLQVQQAAYLLWAEPNKYSNPLPIYQIIIIYYNNYKA